MNTAFTLANLENNVRFDQTVRHIADHWHRSQAHAIGLFMVCLGAVLVVFCCLSAYQRYGRRGQRPRPLAVFRQLARQVGLDWWQRLLLMEVAHRQRLRSPAALLLAPSAYRQYTNRYLDKVGRWRRRAMGAQLDAIAVYLFQGPRDTPPTNSASVPWS